MGWLRLIPACAGKTRPCGSWRGRRRAHPRVCGENSLAAQDTEPQWGSSPRVRGKPRFGARDEPAWGLIPACAGKTSGTAPVRAHGRAHPRVCGENATGAGGKGWVGGSSPRVRGKLRQVRRDRRRSRLIPACAGKTSPERACRTRTRAHPRVCGENPMRSACAAWPWGSSPRVRGKPSGHRHCHRSPGLIPACAGKTASWASPGRGTRAHPRVCGENS